MHTISGEQTNPCAEVIQSSLDSFVAHCWKWDVVPSFGSLVTTEDKQSRVYGVVYDSKTESLDPMHTMHVYKKTETEMRKEYPHVFDFLKTICNILVLGFEQNDVILYSKTVRPVQLFSLVSLTNDKQTNRFFSSNDNMSQLILTKNSLPNYQELVISLILRQKQLGYLSAERFSLYTSQYESSTGASYQQLQQFIDRIERA